MLLNEIKIQVIKINHALKMSSFTIVSMSVCLHSGFFMLLIH